jgi:HAD superfamily hydrolase (TIGR01509 family)
MIKAVIFDMDGVLIDSEGHWDNVVEGLIASGILPGWDPARNHELAGMNIPDIHGFLASEFGMGLPREEFLEIFDRAAGPLYGEMASPVPGSFSLARELQKRGFGLAIASSSPQKWIDAVVERFRLGQFGVVVSGEQVPNGKPAPDIFLAAAERLGVEPSECVVIEDSAKGVAAARAAGMKCVGLSNGFNREQDLSGADMVVRGMGELTAEAVRKM